VLITTPSLGLSGTLPPSLGLLNGSLTYALFINAQAGLSGTLPSQIGALSKLQFLSLDGAALSGSIPPQLGALTKLQQLALGSNNLSGDTLSVPRPPARRAARTRSPATRAAAGTLPSQLGGLLELSNAFDVSGNAISGSLPSEARRPRPVHAWAAAPVATRAVPHRHRLG
jgi:hypothetical protein